MRSFVALCPPLVLVAACSSSSPTSVPPPAPQTSSTFTFSMKQTIAAGSEAFRCELVQVGDDATWANHVSHTYTPGSHHLLLYVTDYNSIPAGLDQAQDCYGENNAFMPHIRGFIYGSQIAQDSFDLPEGVGWQLHPGEVLLLQTHYLNATPQNLDAEADVTITWYTGDGAMQRAGTMGFYDPFIYVPAGAQNAVAGMRCPVPNDVTILRVIPHTHARGVGFKAWLDSPSGEESAQPFYTSADWEHPAPYTGGPMQIAAGSKVRFECDYSNAGGTADFFQGSSAKTNEMCLFGALYYPEMGLQADLCDNDSKMDLVGKGTTTCKDTHACIMGCLQKAEALDDPCIQKCVVASCPKAWSTYYPLLSCARTACKDACAVGQPGAQCTACAQQNCATEQQACDVSACQ